MTRSRRPELAILVLTVFAFGLISWASLSSQAFLAAARSNPSVKPEEAVTYTGAGDGPLTWMRQQAFAGIPTLTGLGTSGRPVDASSAAESASKEVSEDFTDSTANMASPASQPTAAADAAAASVPRPGEVADVHADGMPAASAPGGKARPADAIAPDPKPATYIGAFRSRACLRL